jgi:NAD(P)-binding Rossmann-like domain
MTLMSTSTDYLVIGAGAMGMAFADTVLGESNCTVTIVDRYQRPGGHWTTAYPFVRLHQPSAFYGVNSKPLGTDSLDQVGWNKGLYELASADEVCAYFGQLMQQRLLPSGRVSYFPVSEYLGDGRFRSLVTGQVQSVDVKRRVVDATYMRVTVPSMRPPPYEIAAGVHCVSPNGLARITQPYPHYSVIGAGKTGMDTCLWLLAHGVSAADISWVMPRDSWLIDRTNAQPGQEFGSRMLAIMQGQGAAILEASSVDDLMDRLVACGALLRFSDEVRPTMYRCASVSPLELEQLRNIRRVVRLGRVRRLDRDRMTLDQGTAPFPEGTLYVDCSADGLERRPAVPVFDDSRITLQAIRTCQQTFSAAFVAHVEMAYTDDATRNHLCAPVPHPDDSVDWLKATRSTYQAMLKWNEDESLTGWLQRSRLDWFGRMAPPLPTESAERSVAVKAIRDSLEPLIARLSQLIGDEKATA